MAKLWVAYRYRAERVGERRCVLLGLRVPLVVTPPQRLMRGARQVFVKAYTVRGSGTFERSGTAFGYTGLPRCGLIPLAALAHVPVLDIGRAPRRSVRVWFCNTILSRQGFGPAFQAVRHLSAVSEFSRWVRRPEEL